MSQKMPLFERPDHPPRAVLLAVGLLSLLFLGGLVYLMLNNPFTPADISGPGELPPVTAALAEYKGPLWGLESARGRVREALVRRGSVPGPSLTVFPVSPLRLRPIAVACRVGYLLPAGAEVAGLNESILVENLTPGQRLTVRVPGQGNFTGTQAYRAAVRYLEPQGLKPGDGERYELKERRGGRDFIEHWIPLQPRTQPDQKR